MGRKKFNFFVHDHTSDERPHFSLEGRSQSEAWRKETLLAEVATPEKAPSNLLHFPHLPCIGGRGEWQDEPVWPDHLLAELLLQVLHHLLLDGGQLVRQPGRPLSSTLMLSS